MNQWEAVEAVQKRLEATSRQLYRSGLSKAGAGDLSRAVEDLRKALWYNKHNEKARNLLGLIEFQRGEIGEAVYQWKLSESLSSNANWASYYLKELEKEKSLVTDMSTSVDLYNEAGELAAKDSLDFAITRLRKAVHLNPRFVRAQLLLALCYMETQHYKTALRMLDQVAKVDPLNPDAMRYRLYIAQQRSEGVEEDTLDDIQDLSRDLYVQQALPEPSKEELFYEKKGRKKAVRGMSGSLMQILLFFAGVLCCFGFMRTLWYPAEIKSLENRVVELELSENALRNDKEALQERINKAGEVLTEVSKGKGNLLTSVLADVDQILTEWGLKE